MVEFTGERLIPGQVDIDLLNEHLARYVFAGRLVRGKRVLDAGCGTGYGSAELAHTAASVLGADISAEALEYASAHYRLSNLGFEQASCTALPHPDASFDMVVAFEVIEHLENWREFLREVKRVLAPSGQFIVSTPNKLYYTESRGKEGANPFHVHEFDFAEFRTELTSIFPNVSMFLENHVEGVSFQPFDPGNTVEIRLDAGEPKPHETHFFVAVCAHRLQTGNPAFVYVPRAGNVLRERGRHIELLEQEVATKNEWLAKAATEHDELLRVHRAQTEELQRANEWAQSLDRDLRNELAKVHEGYAAKVRDLEEDLQLRERGYAAKVKELEDEILEKVQWAMETNAQLKRALDALAHAEHELEERTAWALRLDSEKQQLLEQLALVRASRWVKLGNRVGLGPTLPPA